MITTTLATGKNPRVAPVTAFANPFGKYKQEGKQPIRLPGIKNDENLQQFEASWQACLSKPERFEHHLYYYVIENKLMRNPSYSSADVEAFSVMLARYQDEKDFSKKASVFLSALINRGKDTDYVIHTSHFGCEMNYLGIYNTKNITINGDVGRNFGEYMKSGHVVIKGNAGAFTGLHLSGGTVVVEGNTMDRLGANMDGGELIVKGVAGMYIGSEMRDGRIIVEGNAGCFIGIRMHAGEIVIMGNAEEDAGWEMKGGKVIILSDAKGCLGWKMEGGEIHIEGKYAVIADSCRGRIYHKGKLIRGTEVDIHV